MAKQDIKTYQQNIGYKKEFQRLNLDLDEVFEFTPLDLDLENRRLESLLEFVKKFLQYGSQKAMEAFGGRFIFPPIYPGISPSSDWYRFELWMQGKPTRKTIEDQLPKTFVLKKAEDIPDEDIVKELECLVIEIEKAGYGVSIIDDIPERVQYNAILEWIAEKIELDVPGFSGWYFDGCSGYCPGCFQRPWCETGNSSCWTEDKEAGKMFLIEELKDYVSPSPQSLEILSKLQAQEDERIEKFMKNNTANEFGSSDESGDNWKAKQN